MKSTKPEIRDGKIKHLSLWLVKQKLGAKVALQYLLSNNILKAHQTKQAGC